MSYCLAYKSVINHLILVSTAYQNFTFTLKILRIRCYKENGSMLNPNASISPNFCRSN